MRRLNLSNRFIFFTFGILAIFVASVYILTSRVRAITQSRFENDSIYQYSLIWDSLVKQKYLMMEQQITALTRDKDLLNGLFNNDINAVAQAVLPTSNRLIATEAVSQILIYDIDSKLVWPSKSELRASESRLLAQQSLSSASIVSGFDLLSNGNTAYLLSFPLYLRGRIVGSAIYLRDLSSEVSNLKLGSGALEVYLRSSLSKNDFADPLQKFLIESLSLGSETTIKERYINSNYYQIIGLPIISISKSLISNIYFIRNTTNENLLEKRSIDRLRLFGMLIILFCLIALYIFIVREGAKLLNIETERNYKLNIANKKMQEAAECKSNFLSAISHELRTPLNGILSLVELLMSSPLDEHQRSDVVTIKECGDNLNHIVDSIFEFSALSNNTNHNDLNVISLAQLLNEVRKKFEESASARSIEFLVVDREDRMPDFVIADQTKLRRIFDCLISNAIKYSDSSGAVIVYFEMLSKLGSEITLHGVVADTGIGIPMEKQQEIFSPFTQIDNTVTRSHGGIGLGLALTKLIVEMMGGRIWLESKVGIGSAFHFEIKVLLASQEQIESYNQAPAESFKNIRFENRTKAINKILLVEDFAPDQSAISRALTKGGFHVTVADSGGQALNVAQQENFDLILMDLHIPDINGMNIAQTIMKGSSVNSGIPIIALTSDTNVALRSACREIGMQGYLSKPLSMENFKSLVASFSRDSEGIL